MPIISFAYLCFTDFAKRKSAEDAMSAMNKSVVGGEKLRVAISTVPPDMSQDDEVGCVNN